MTSSTIDNLGAHAADTALKAAVTFLRTELGQDALRAVANGPEADHLLNAVRHFVKAALAEAMDDAREALEAMPTATGIAAATFAASMALAGIEGAKAFLAER